MGLNPSRLSCHPLDAKIGDSLLVTCIQHDATEHSLLQSSSLWHSPWHIMMCPLWNSWPSSQPSHCIKNLFMLPSQHMQWHRQTQSLRFLPLLLPHWKRPILLHIHRVIHGIVPQHCSRLVVFFHSLHHGIHQQQCTVYQVKSQLGNLLCLGKGCGGC